MGTAVPSPTPTSPSPERFHAGQGTGRSYRLSFRRIQVLPLGQRRACSLRRLEQARPDPLRLLLRNDRSFPLSPDGRECPGLLSRVQRKERKLLDRSRQAGLLFEMDLGEEKILSDSSFKVQRLREYKNQTLLRNDYPNYPQADMLAERNVYYDARDSIGEFMDPNSTIPLGARRPSSAIRDASPSTISTNVPSLRWLSTTSSGLPYRRNTKMSPYRRRRQSRSTFRRICSSPPSSRWRRTRGEDGSPTIQTPSKARNGVLQGRLHRKGRDAGL